MQKKILTLLGLTTLCFSGTVFAQTYPTKPVRVIVSTVPGPLDTFARMVTEKLDASLNQPFIF